MPTFRQTFTGAEPEDFPAPPIACRLQPGDVVEYEADQPIEHARLELLAEEPPGLGWWSPAHGLCRVGRDASAALAALGSEVSDAAAALDELERAARDAVVDSPETPKPPANRRAPTKE